MKKDSLTKEQKLLLYVVKRAVNGADDSPIRDCDFSSYDYKEFIKESIYQAVCYIAIENSEFLKPYIPQDMYFRWKQRAISIAVNDVSVVNSQNELTEMLGGKYKYVILKGLAAASYYPCPDLRNLGDVDFLVEDADKDAIKDLLISRGYTCNEEYNDHHVVLTRAKSILEMHFEIPGIPYGEIGEKIRKFMSGVFKDSITSTIDNGFTADFSAPDKMRHGLILILHMQHHMLGEGLGLRHLIDWACFINSTANEPFWKELIAFFKEIGLFIYTAAITKTCALYFGSVCPDWCKFIKDKLCYEIIADSFRLGNFGNKNASKSKSGSFISEHGKDGTNKSRMAHLLKLFDSSIRSRHKSLEKYKINYPFFFVYEIFRYWIDTVRGERPSVFKLLRDAKERKSVYEKLHVFETK